MISTIIHLVCQVPRFFFSTDVWLIFLSLFPVESGSINEQRGFSFPLDLEPFTLDLQESKAVFPQYGQAFQES